MILFNCLDDRILAVGSCELWYQNQELEPKEHSFHISIIITIIIIIIIIVISIIIIIIIIITSFFKVDFYVTCTKLQKAN